MPSSADFSIRPPMRERFYDKLKADSERLRKLPQVQPPANFSRA